jgi:small subunit ribosomal protein S16
MLVIRMQRTGRKGHAMFRVVVQDSRRTPTSGKVVARLGSYDPHAKAIVLDKEKAAFYLDHGAQPSDRIARLLKSEGVKLPDWVKLAANKERTVRNADKRRSTRPDEPALPAEEPAPTEEEPAETPAAETPETPAAEATEESAAEPAAEEPAPEPETSEETPEEAPKPEEPPETTAKEDETPAEDKPAEDAKAA